MKSVTAKIESVTAKQTSVTTKAKFGVTAKGNSKAQIEAKLEANHGSYPLNKKFSFTKENVQRN